jgi:hypothetical protein
MYTIGRILITAVLIGFITLSASSTGYAQVDIEDIATRGGYADWRLAWGGEGVYDRAHDTCVDPDGNIYVIGIFGFDVDFDPGPGVARREMQNAYFLSKFSPGGEFQWVRTWEGANINVEPCVAAGDDGSVYVTGWFHGAEVDLDPGPADSGHTAVQNHSFLSRFDRDGNFYWVKTWGGEWWAQVYDLDLADNGNILLAGCFGGQADLDPGPETFIAQCNGRLDSYVSSLRPDGSLAWAHTFGGRGGEGLEIDTAYGVKASHDGYILATGGFNGSVDFDPGEGTDLWASNGAADAWLVKYDSNGDEVWCRTWGGDRDDRGVSVGVDAAGNVYALGFFSGNVAFNPESRRSFIRGTSTHSIFLCKYDPSGGYLWTCNWAASERGDCIQLVVGDSGDSYAAGDFTMQGALSGAVRVEDYPDMGLLRMVMVGFDSEGNLVAFCPLERQGPSYGLGLCLDGSGALYITGMYDHIVDFDPEFGPTNIDERMTTGNMDVFLTKFVLD